MELSITSPLIELELDIADGATATKLLWPGAVSSVAGGLRAKWFAAQITADNRLTLHKLVDLKGKVIEKSKKNFPVFFDLTKTGDLEYCSRVYADKVCNIFKQTTPAAQWVYLEFDWAKGNITKQLNLNNPDDGSDIIYFTKKKHHLYYLVQDSADDLWLYYLNLKLFANKATILNPTWRLQVITDKTDMLAGKNNFYLYTESGGDPVIKVYSLGSIVVNQVWTDPLLGDTYKQYPVSLHEVDDLELYLRKRDTDLFKINQGVSVQLNNDMEDDADGIFALQNYGKILIEGINHLSDPGQSDSQNDAWYVDQLLPAQTTTLDLIITRLCNEIGIQNDQIDVSELEEIEVDGYKIESKQSVLTLLQFLRTAYFFDILKEEGIYKFKRRGDTPTVLNKDWFGAYIGQYQFSDVSNKERAADTQIPSRITVQFKNKAIDYKINQQTINREQIENESELVLDLTALALSSTHARKIADATLSVAISERTKLILRTPFYYFELEPGDFISITWDENLIQTYRIVSQTYNPYGLIEFQCVLDDAENYASVMAGIEDGDNEQGLEYAAGSQLALLDIPLLSPSDDIDTGFYYGVGAQDTGDWPGAHVYNSQDSGVTWNKLLLSYNETIIGFAVTTLNTGPIAVIDYANSVTVQLFNTDKVLESVTKDEMLAGANRFYLAGEIFHAQDVEVVDGFEGRYTLSTLLRGTLGTEHAVGTHDEGDRFVVLDDTVTKLTYPSLPGVQDYIAVNIGSVFPPTNPDDLESILEDMQVFQPTGVVLKPWSPAFFDATKKGNGDIDFTWIRRTRHSGNTWTAYMSVPLNEDEEQYEIDVYDGDTVTRTLTSTQQDKTYSEAQQIEDFGSGITEVKAIVYQISAAVGRGYGTLLEKTF
jgi:hypothetical protein